MGIFSAPNIVRDGLILAYDGANVRSFRGVPTVNYLSNPTQTFNSSEFQQYYDLRAIFETNGLVPYSLSFDMRADKPGDVYWYMQNGSYTKYAFVGHNRSATTQWQRFTIENVTPSGPTAAWQANTPSDNRAMLATYTGYGSGVYPQVKNIQLELGTVATPFVAGTRGTTNATGGGWVDLSGNSNHGELVNGPTYSSANGGSIVFDGTNDYVSTPNTAALRPSTELTVSLWIKANSITSGWNRLFGQDPYTGGYLIFLESGGSLIRALHYPNGVEVRCNTNYAISTTQFTHVTFTFKMGDAIRSYFNGTASTTVGLSAGTFSYNTTNPFLLGHQGASWFNGQIANLQVYDRALSAAEVAQNFNATRDRFGV